MLKDENLNSLAGALQKDKQSNLNPALKNIQSGIYHAITVHSNPKTGELYIDPEGRGSICPQVRWKYRLSLIFSICFAIWWFG